MGRHHFIALGRVAPDIAQQIMTDYNGSDELVIDQPGNVFQSRIGAYKDGECIGELYTNGEHTDYPVVQNLSESQKREMDRNLKGAHVTVVHSISGENAGNRAMSLLDYVYELKHNYGVGSITLVAPYAPMRVDRRFSHNNPDADNGEPKREYQRNATAARNLMRRLRQEGVDRFINFDPHSVSAMKHARDFFGHENLVVPKTPAKFVTCAGFLAQEFSKAHNPLSATNQFRVVIGSPDGLDKPQDMGIARAKEFANAYYEDTDYAGFEKDTPIEDIDVMFGIHKKRHGDGVTEILQFEGDVKDKIVAVVDDIDSSGGTKIDAAKALKARGAAKIVSLSTHGVLVDGNKAPDQLKTLLQDYMDEGYIDQSWLENGVEGLKEKIGDMFDDLVEDAYVNTTLKKMLTSDAIDEVWMTDSIPGVIDKIRQAGYEDHPKLNVVSMAKPVIEEIEWDHTTIGGLEWKYNVLRAAINDNVEDNNDTIAYIPPPAAE